MPTHMWIWKKGKKLTCECNEAFTFNSEKSEREKSIKFYKRKNVQEKWMEKWQYLSKFKSFFSLTNDMVHYFSFYCYCNARSLRSE